MFNFQFLISNFQSSILWFFAFRRHSTISAKSFSS